MSSALASISDALPHPPVHACTCAPQPVYPDLAVSAVPNGSYEDWAVDELIID